MCFSNICHCCMNRIDLATIGLNSVWTRIELNFPKCVSRSWKLRGCLTQARYRLHKKVFSDLHLSQNSSVHPKIQILCFYKIYLLRNVNFVIYLHIYIQQNLTQLYKHPLKVATWNCYITSIYQNIHTNLTMVYRGWS